MLVGDAGMPLHFANRYAYSMFEKAGRSLSTIKQSLFVISRLYLWAEVRDIDVERILFYGDFLNLDQTSDIIDFIQYTSTTQNKILKIKLKTNESKKTDLGKISSYEYTSNQLYANRLRALGKFLKWVLVERQAQRIATFITYSVITNQLGHGQVGKSIFARNNLLNPKTGEPWKIGSHQPRHLLNTIAQSKHLSQELIAFWSGRKSIKQNDYYDHTSQEFIIEAYLRLEENAPKELIVTGPLAEKIEERYVNEPISRDEAMKEELAAFHKTKYGYCRHDFSLTPCPKDKWCNNCGEAYFAKGDERQIKMAEQDIAKFIRSIATAKRAKADGEYGVEQWIDKLELELYRANLKLKKLTDPTVEDGTLITLPPPKISQSKAGLSMEIRRTEN